MSKHNWLELKVKFMTGDYKSLREFAKEQDIPYNPYFKEKTRGWASERDTQLSQLCWEMSKSSLENKAKEFVELKQVIDEAGVELFCFVNDFIKNKDFNKFTVKQKIDGVNSIDTVELDYIKINDINKAVNSLNKLNKILIKAYPSLAKATGL